MKLFPSGSTWRGLSQQGLAWACSPPPAHGLHKQFITMFGFGGPKKAEADIVKVNAARKICRP